MNIQNNQNLNNSLSLGQNLNQTNLKTENWLGGWRPLPQPIRPFPDFHGSRPIPSMPMQIRIREYANNMMQSMLSQLNSAFSMMMNNMMHMFQKMMSMFSGLGGWFR
jgi:hypothetical protein